MKGYPLALAARLRLLAIAIAVIALPIVSHGVSTLSSNALGPVQPAGPAVPLAQCDKCERWAAALRERTAALDRAEAEIADLEKSLAQLENERDDLQRRSANAPAAEQRAALESRLKDVTSAADDGFDEIKKRRDEDLPSLRIAVEEARRRLADCNASCVAPPLREDSTAQRALCPECVEAEAGCSDGMVKRLDDEYDRLKAEFDKRSAEPLPPEMPDRGNEAVSRQRMQERLTALISERNNAANNAAIACRKLASCNQQLCGPRQTQVLTGTAASTAPAVIRSPFDPPVGVPGRAIPPFVPPSVRPAGPNDNDTARGVTPASPGATAPPSDPCEPCRALAQQLVTAEAQLKSASAEAEDAREKFELVAGVNKSGLGNAQLLPEAKDAIQKNQLAQQKERAASAAVDRLRAQMEECFQKCNAPVVEQPQRTDGPPSSSTAADPYGRNVTVANPALPLSPVDFWRNCLPLDNCPPVDSDPFIPGNFPLAGPPAGPPFVNVFDEGVWTTSIRIEIEIHMQDKQAEIDPELFPNFLQPFNPPNFPGPAGPNTFPSLLIPSVQQQQVREWFNPLGLLARTIGEHVDRWRASMGPRPLLTARDLDTLDRVSNVQAAGLPKGVHVMLTDQGGSTGRTLVMSLLNLSGQPVRLASKPFAVQPLKQQAQQQVLQAFNRLSKATPVKLTLSAYCVEMLKAPPSANTMFRLAPPDLQRKYAPMTKILQSAYRVAKSNALHPDSNPAAYADSIKQWSLWVVEQKLNESRFTDAFIAHTRKNVEAAGQKWPPQAEQQVRQVAPNRWRDIVTILKGADIQIPQ